MYEKLLIKMTNMVKVQSLKMYLINLNYTDSVADANSSVKFLTKKSKTSSPNILKEFKFNLILGPTPEYKAIFYFGFYRFNNAYVGPLHTTHRSNSLTQSYFFGLFPSSVLMKHNVSEVVSASFFRQWMEIALSKGSTRLGAFVDWRRKNSRLPKRRDLLQIIRRKISKKGDYISESYTIIDQHLLTPIRHAR